MDVIIPSMPNKEPVIFFLKSSSSRIRPEALAAGPALQAGLRGASKNEHCLTGKLRLAGGKRRIRGK